MLSPAVVALCSAVVLAVLMAAPPASSTPAALAGDGAADAAGDPHWRWTGAGACPLFCTCFRRQQLRRVECAGRRLAGVAVGLPADTEAADLSHNAISSLEDGCFQELGLVQLRELYLQHNAIHTVGPWAFTGLRRLRVLDLSYNHLQTLYDNTFASNRGLNTLVLAGNNLARLPPDQPLPAAPRLQVLDLSSCKVAHLGAAVLAAMPALASLNLSDNLLIQLQPQALAAQPQLQLLDLTRNPLACDVNTRHFVKQLEARNVTVRQSCPSKEDQSQIVSKSMARILADIEDGPGHEGGVRARPKHPEAEVGAPARPPGRTHEAMVNMAEAPALELGEFANGDLVDFGLDDEEPEAPVTTTPAVSRADHKDCMTLFPDRTSMNPSLLRPWFDPIPSFWASVVGCQVGLVLGLCLSSCLCRRSFWRALCCGPPGPSASSAPLRDQRQGSPSSPSSGRSWHGVRNSLGWSPSLRSGSGTGSSAESTPCLWRDSFSSLERLQQQQPQQRPETPPPAYEDLVRGRVRLA